MNFSFTDQKMDDLKVLKLIDKIALDWAEWKRKIHVTNLS